MNQEVKNQEIKGKAESGNQELEGQKQSKIKFKVYIRIFQVMKPGL